MRYEIIIPTLVRAEITEAVSYYNLKQEGLGDTLYYDLLEVLDFIEKAPSSFQKYHYKYSQASLKKFSYLLIFRIYGSRILINKFIHAKRHPARRYKKQ